MFIDIAQIPAEGLDVHFRGSEDLLDASGERVYLLRPIEATIHFCRTPAAVWGRGQISSDLQLHCSRCFELFSLPVSEDFEVQYRSPPRQEEEHELGRDELDVSFLEEGKINIAGLVRENVMLALPVQPLCREGCRGLCPRCGVNLNEGTCSCCSTALDPRWKDLESLL